MRVRDLGFVLAAAAFAGCGSKDPVEDAPAAKEAGGGAHEHETGPHGGELAVVGEEEAHLELLHDPRTGDLTIHVLGADGRTPKAIAAPVVNLTAASGPVQVTPAAVDAAVDGTASTWRATHEALAADPLDGRIRVLLGGKTHHVLLAHEH